MADLQPSTPQKLTPVVIVSREPRRFETIDLLDGLSRLMDRCFTIPGSDFRFGINSLLLLMPGIGDAIAGAISTFILVIALTHYRVPRIVAARMILNSVLDAAVSAIPVVGNLWDVWYKADTRNVNLLRQYVTITNDPPPATWRHWAFVVGVFVLCVALLALLAVGSVAVLIALVRMLQPQPA
jgi:hypothetical protein